MASLMMRYNCNLSSQQYFLFCGKVTLNTLVALRAPIRTSLGKEHRETSTVCDGVYSELNGRAP